MNHGEKEREACQVNTSGSVGHAMAWDTFILHLSGDLNPGYSPALASCSHTWKAHTKMKSICTRTLQQVQRKCVLAKSAWISNFFQSNHHLSFAFFHVIFQVPSYCPITFEFIKQWRCPYQTSVRKQKNLGRILLEACRTDIFFFRNSNDKWPKQVQAELKMIFEKNPSVIFHCLCREMRGE